LTNAEVMLYDVCWLADCNVYISDYVQGGPKTDCFLTVCNSRICCHRI